MSKNIRSDAKAVVYASSRRIIISELKAFVETFTDRDNLETILTTHEKARLDTLMKKAALLADDLK